MKKVRNDFFQRATFLSSDFLLADCSAEERQRVLDIDWHSLEGINEFGWPTHCFSITPVTFRSWESYTKRRRTTTPIIGHDEVVQRGGYYGEIFYSRNLEEILLIPEEARDTEMCNLAHAKYGIEALKLFVPKEKRTSHMYTLIFGESIDSFEKYLGDLSSEVIDDNLLSVIARRLQDVIMAGKTVSAADDVVNIILKRDATLLKAFDYEIRTRVIWIELTHIVTNKRGSLERIGEKYGISPLDVAIVLKSKSTSDFDTVSSINSVIDTTKAKDVKELSSIIDFLGIGEREKKELTVDEKIAFSYLSSKFLVNRLKDIYKFNATGEYSGDATFKVTSLIGDEVYYYNPKIGDFCSEFLKFDSIGGVVEFAEPYKTEKFFGINSQGMPTIDRSYSSKDSERGQLTMELAALIVDLLKKNDIPLTNIIVSEAFRMYFAGNLDDYLGRVAGYSDEFSEFKSEGMGKK